MRPQLLRRISPASARNPGWREVRSICIRIDRERRGESKTMGGFACRNPGLLLLETKNGHEHDHDQLPERVGALNAWFKSPPTNAEQALNLFPVTVRQLSRLYAAPTVEKMVPRGKPGATSFQNRASGLPASTIVAKYLRPELVGVETRLGHHRGDDGARVIRLAAPRIQRESIVPKCNCGVGQQMSARLA